MRCGPAQKRSSSVGGTAITRNRGGFAFDPATSSWRTVAAAPVDIDGAVAGVDRVGTDRVGRREVRRHVGIALAQRTTLQPTHGAGSPMRQSGSTWRAESGPVPSSSCSGRSLIRGTTHRRRPRLARPTIRPRTRGARSLHRTSPLRPTRRSGRAIAWWLTTTLWKAQAYTPSTDSWKPLHDVPFEPSECYPDGAIVGTQVFAFGCGYVATLDAGSDAWRKVQGGIGNETIEANAGTYELWRFATLVPAGDVLFLPAEGITVKNGAPCYGCSGSPTSLWAYRPAG